jgi:hypothetical protein
VADSSIILTKVLLLLLLLLSSSSLLLPLLLKTFSGRYDFMDFSVDERVVLIWMLNKRFVDT